MNRIHGALISSHGGKYSMDTCYSPFKSQKANKRFLNDRSLMDSIKSNIFARNKNAMDAVDITGNILSKIKTDPEVSSFFGNKEKPTTNRERESIFSLFSKTTSDVEVPINNDYVKNKKIDKSYCNSHVGTITSFDPFKIS